MADKRAIRYTRAGLIGPAASGLLVAAGVLAMALALMLPAVPAAAAAMGRVAGQVVVEATGAPVAGATVSLPDFGLRAVSAGDGSFAFGRALPTSWPYRRIRAEVTAPGWGTWRIEGVPLWPGDTLELRAELRREPFTDHVLTPAERGAARDQTPASNAVTGNTCSGWVYNTVPTPKIRVYLTKQKRSRQYDFVFYARHVLPNEWIPTWDPDALGAGAVAVKTYGGYRAQPGHAYSGNPGCADITDWTNDQVFDPSWSTDATDQAVYATFGSILLRSRVLFLSQYWAGSQDDPCAHVDSGPFAGRMSQWGTENCANQHMLWPEIVTTFYSETTWSYVQNLLLDGSIQAGGAALGVSWYATPGTFMTQMFGGAYNGGSYLSVKPPANHSSAGTVYQTRGFLGAASTTYHEEVALRCGPENPGPCHTNLRLIAIASNGNQVVNRYMVTEPRDGAWRVYDHDVPPSGMDHVQVQLSVISWQGIGVDAASLTGPFGGP